MKERVFGLDMVRMIAIILVIALHSITLGHTFTAAFGTMEFLFLYARHLASACVPLFMILTGFLQRNKKFNASYYFGIIPVFLSYFVISVICICTYEFQKMPEPEFWESAVKIFDFSANGYAWYFEMYVGLFLLIPFLNLIYGGVKTRGGKLGLIATLAFLTLLPDTVVGFSPYYDGNGGTIALNIIPDFFKSMYPVTYYFVGCFISEYRPRLHVLKKIAFLIFAPLVPSLIVAYFSVGRGAYAWYLFNGNQTLTVCITAVAVFLAFYDINIRFTAVRLPVQLISACSFEMYLMSYLADKYVYSLSELSNKYNIVATFAIVLVSSFIMAGMVKLPLTPICSWLKKLYRKITKNSLAEL